MTTPTTEPTSTDPLPIVDAADARDRGYLGGVDSTGARVWYGLVPMRVRIQVRHRDGASASDTIVQAQRYTVTARQPAA